MNRLSQYRPSPAMIVACVALFVALGGVSYGVATGSIDTREIKNSTIRGKDIRNGTITGSDVGNSRLTGSDIRNSSLHGRDILNNSLTGSDINESSLGAVPRANSAGSADSVGSVDHYGKRASATPGADFDTARQAAPQILLAAAGPFTVYGKCFHDDGTDTVYSYTYVHTNEGGSLLDSPEDDYSGNPFLEPGTDEVDREVHFTSASNNSSDYTGSHTAEWNAYAPSGANLVGSAANGAKNGDIGGDGAYGAGDSCVFSGSAIG